MIGKQVLVLMVSPGEQEVGFITTEGTSYVCETFADCCSETWVADILGVQALLSGVVTAFELVEFPEVEDGRTRQEFDEFFGFRITTTKGRCDFVFRNSSNGSYGGDVKPPSLCTLSAFVGWKPVADDFSA